MFQYAAARALSLHLNTSLAIDVTGYNANKYRQYELSTYFNINPVIATKEELTNFNLSHPVRRVWNRVIKYKKLRSLPYEENRFAKLFYQAVYLFRKPHLQHVYEERSFYFDTNFFKASKNIYLRGYWMSYKYFDGYANVIKKDFTIRQHLVAHLFSLSATVNEQDSIAIHIRCTDKKTVPKYYTLYGEMSNEYYTKAVNYIIENQNLQNAKLYVFSDDIDEAKKYTPTHLPVTFVSNTISKSAIEDFYLITQCRHVVMANSTFSWWAAYLNVHTDGIKIIPTPWYAKNQYNAMDLYVPGWIKFNR